MLGLNSQNLACEETSSLAQVVEQWTDDPKAAGSISCRKTTFLHCLFLSSRCSGGSSLGFRTGNL